MEGFPLRGKQGMMKGAYLTRTSGENSAPYLAAYIIGVVAFLVLIYLFRPGPLAIIGGAGILFVLTYGWRVETVPVLFLVYMALSPTSYGPDEWEFYKVFYYPLMAPIAFLVMFILFKLDNSINFISSRGYEKSSEEPSQTDWAGIFIALLMIWVVFQSLRGLALGYPAKAVRFELTHIIVPLGYFVWRALFKRSGNVMPWLFLLLGVEFATALQHYTLIISKWESIFSFLFWRMVTRQGHMTLATVPLILAFLFSSSKRRHMFLWALAMLFVMGHILFTQQRVLMLANAFSFIIFSSLYAFRGGFDRKGLTIWLIGIGALTLLILGALLGAMAAFDVDPDVILTRWQDLGSVKDTSTLLRILDIRHAWQIVTLSPILGQGLGSTLMTVPNAQLYFFIDNSYMIALVKGGFPYLILLLAIYITGLWKSWLVFRKAEKERTKLIGAAIFSSLIAILLTGATNVSLVHYRFGYVWMFLIAAAVFLEDQIREKTTDSTGEEV